MQGEIALNDGLPEIESVRIGSGNSNLRASKRLGDLIVENSWRDALQLVGTAAPSQANNVSIVIDNRHNPIAAKDPTALLRRAA
jgi:hypothetical protein